MYVTYRAHYQHSGSPLDSHPTTYSGIAFFSEELDGLRYANKHGLKLIEVVDGNTLETAINRAAQRS